MKMDYKDIYQDMYDYMISKDVDKLSTLLSDDFVLRHMTGMKQSKQAYLSSIANGTLNYYRATHEKIIEEGHRLIGQSVVLAAVFGGGRSTWHLQLSLDFNDEGFIQYISASTY